MEDLIRTLYAGFNARDIDSVLAQMTDDVDWPNAWEGGRLHGKDAVRAYWTRQFAALDPSVEPRRITLEADGRVRVEVEQRPRPEEEPVTVTHTYTLRSGKIARMDVGAAP